YRGLVISRHAPDTFGGLLVAGVTCWLAYDAMLNIAVMTALVPPTGVPLPFISFGGSSLVATLAGVGLMLSVSRAAGKSPAPEREPETKPMDWREKSADYDLSGRNRGRRVSSISRRRGAP
ncbi:MAG TPA: FtsW/RodA/SpoVE family cell cycle protein, partial [Aggregatilineaceae bacterium]|nr:FtsW/RodA/SpoVE family cell cycle protein [Aggregatilineaceae bacterium]